MFNKERESVEQTLIAMGFASSLIERVMRKNPNQNDNYNVELIMELCLSNKQHYEKHEKKGKMNEQDNMLDPGYGEYCGW